MKKIILGFFLLSFFVSNSYAQGRKAKEKIEAQKIAFITKKLELTAKEAEVFWPIYNQFQRDKEALNQKYRSQKQIQNMSDSELEQHMLNSFQKDQELLDLKKDYFATMKSKFSIRRIATLMAAEKEFRTTILTEWKKRQRERRQRRRQGMEGN